MLRRLALVLVMAGLSVAATIPVTAAARGQLPLIYVDPLSVSIEDWFVFTGSGFEPGTAIIASFIAPDGQPWDLTDNPLVVEGDGTFRLPILPVQDLALVTGRPATVQLGRWVATFTLTEEVYYDVGFVTLP
jgi:hypothetical protein